jgi:hypothetical protein
MPWHSKEVFRRSSRGWNLHSPHTTTLLPNISDTELSISDPNSGIQKRTPRVAVEAGPTTHHHLAAQSQWYRIEYIGSKQWHSEEDSSSSSRDRPATDHHLAAQSQWYTIQYLGSISGIQKRTPGVAVEAGPSIHHHLAAQSQ